MSESGWRWQRTDLPSEMTSFVGREPEIELVRTLFGSARMVTLLGPGGVGESRIAVRAAASLADRFRGGVRMVDPSTTATSPPAAPPRGSRTPSRPPCTPRRHRGPTPRTSCCGCSPAGAVCSYWTPVSTYGPGVLLAARSLRATEPQQLYGSLCTPGERFDVLIHGPKAPARHRSLLNAIEWSHDLCGRVERLLWARLSSFTGSFTGDQVRTVFTGGAELASLVDASVVLREDAGTYRLPLAHREYGQVRLAGLGGPQARTEGSGC
ncbi:hypothetical protein [Streptomyces sp. H27-C3]|uniref:hypothetical protein n=1 Tax=Streptomyces sp. H27-C3 TaxID=3046305 RepID=UPI0024B8F57C|nr:hypothetical protein [Streptomyces sp. H27-C3]MDJ0464522.1 hypothetical protein [Streptomyces sp. H27-C3]